MWRSATRSSTSQLPVQDRSFEHSSIFACHCICVMGFCKLTCCKLTVLQHIVLLIHPSVHPSILILLINLCLLLFLSFDLSVFQIWRVADGGFTARPVFGSGVLGGEYHSAMTWLYLIWRDLAWCDLAWWNVTVTELIWPNMTSPNSSIL